MKLVAALFALLVAFAVADELGAEWDIQPTWITKFTKDNGHEAMAKQALLTALANLKERHGVQDADLFDPERIGKVKGLMTMDRMKKALTRGVRWNDMPEKKGSVANTFKFILKFLFKPKDDLITRSHFGCYQYFHGMCPISYAPKGDYGLVDPNTPKAELQRLTFTNADVQKLIRKQFIQWWYQIVGKFEYYLDLLHGSEEMKEHELVHPFFLLGNMIHTVGDSFAPGHTLRGGRHPCPSTERENAGRGDCGQIFLFQGYTLQHGTDAHTKSDHTPSTRKPADRRRRELYQCGIDANTDLMEHTLQCYIALKEYRQAAPKIKRSQTFASHELSHTRQRPLYRSASMPNMHVSSLEFIEKEAKAPHGMTEEGGGLLSTAHSKRQDATAKAGKACGFPEEWFDETFALNLGEMDKIAGGSTAHFADAGSDTPMTERTIINVPCSLEAGCEHCQEGTESSVYIREGCEDVSVPVKGVKSDIAIDIKISHLPKSDRKVRRTTLTKKSDDQRQCSVKVYEEKREPAERFEPFNWQKHNWHLCYGQETDRERRLNDYYKKLDHMYEYRKRELGTSERGGRFFWRIASDALPAEERDYERDLRQMESSFLDEAKRGEATHAAQRVASKIKKLGQGATRIASGRRRRNGIYIASDKSSGSSAYGGAGTGIGTGSTGTSTGIGGGGDIGGASSITLDSSFELTA